MAVNILTFLLLLVWMVRTEMLLNKLVVEEDYDEDFDDDDDDECNLVIRWDGRPGLSIAHCRRCNDRKLDNDEVKMTEESRYNEMGTQGTATCRFCNAVCSWSDIGLLKIAGTEMPENKPKQKA